MPAVCLYFQVHQPYRVKRYRVFDIGNDPWYFNAEGETNLNNARILKKVADKSYRPATRILKALLEQHPEFKLSFSISGVALEQLSFYAPDVIETIREMVNTGRCEILGETYHHSLAFFHSRDEFEAQVAAHQALVKKLFAATPKVFRNTELSYTNTLGLWADKKGYRAILAEGWDPVLGWRSPNFVYRPKGAATTRLLLKNYRLSDDIAFRFGERSWEGWPLTAEKFADWVSSHNGNAETINLFMDFETFGEHQWEDTGIFHFLEALPRSLLRVPDTTFMTPSEVATSFEARDEINVPGVVTWADTERDLSAWMGNDMQQSALRSVYALEKAVEESGNESVLESWRRLQTSDHFYYMCTKWFNDGDVHAYFNPYESPYDAFISYMNALQDLKLRIQESAKMLV